MEQNSLYDVMDLKALRCFWAMARQGSMTRAGIELGVSESAVSQRVKALESYVGSKLYEAPGGRIRLTQAGDRVMEMAVSLFDRLGQFQQELSGEQASGSLTLATQEAIVRYLLPEVIRRFTRDDPQVRLQIMSRRILDTVEMVRTGEVDMGIISQVPLPEGLTFHPWKTYEAYLLFPVGHPLMLQGRPAFKDLLNPETVNRNPLIVPERDDPAYSRVVRALDQLGLPFKVAFEVGTIEALKHYVQVGLGIAVVSGICLIESDAGKLDAIEIPKEYAGTTTYGVVLRRDRYLSSALRHFLDAAGVSLPSIG